MTPETTAETVDFRQNKRLLNRYRFVEYELIKILAAWLPATAHMETKLELGRLLWEDAQHVQQLFLRLREVQTPAFRPPEDPALEALMAEALHAPTAEDLLAGLFHVIKPRLVAAYSWHHDQTFANPDAPTRYYLRHILADEREHLAWAKGALADHRTERTHAWEAYIAELLAAAGGITGEDQRGPAPARPPCRREFRLPRVAARDARFSTDMSRLTKPADEDRAGQRLAEFQNYAQEVLAAETVARILYQTAGMPWEFTYDLARHCYDETRHCKLGIEWLAQHGLDYTAYPQNVRVYAWRSQYDPLTQYTLLTMGNESHVFPYRQQRLKEYQAEGDRLSVQYLSYDMADERQHVAFGHRWLPELMRWQGETRSQDDFVAATVELWTDEYVSGSLPLLDQSEH
jgi:hypothetical protein